MKIAKVAVSTKEPAEITIKVTQFREVLAPEASRAGRGTDYEMKMRKRHPRVFIKADTIHIKTPGAVLRFTITSSPEDKEKYYPAGITFVREGLESTSDGQRLGKENFLQRKIFLDGRTLTLTDSYKDEARGVRYKFSVIIQRGSDGAIGIIDPGIEHDDSDPH
jgi:hypothetical protein